MWLNRGCKIWLTAKKRKGKERKKNNNSVFASAWLRGWSHQLVHTPSIDISSNRYKTSPIHVSSNSTPKLEDHFEHEPGYVTVYFLGSLICIQRTCLSHGLLEFASNLPLGGGPDANFGKPWHIIYIFPILGIHVEFLSMIKKIKIKIGSLGLHLQVWSELGQSWPFWPIRDLRVQ
jgi:hypothetical protein